MKFYHIVKKIIALRFIAIIVLACFAFSFQYKDVKGYTMSEVWDGSIV